MANNSTVFQRLGRLINNKSGDAQALKKVSKYNIDGSNVIFQTKNKDEYEKTLNQIKQEKLVAMQWVKAGIDSTQETLGAKTQMEILFRDCDLMDAWPEIAAALDIMAEETCVLSSKGKMINIDSSSERIKSILEDLFVNRLDVNMWLPLITRNMCKYGNTYMLLNLTANDGILGWRQIRTQEVERLENGVTNPYITAAGMDNATNVNTDNVQFVWVGHNDSTPYKSWQMAHFRLLTDSFFLPYGMSVLHKARRAWKMLSIMEDMMLVYRLERSIERRVFKIYVGAIDDKDVPAYINQIANNFKRTPIVDPLTGQIDLRKNFMDVSSDYFIPVRSESAPTPIENLQSANNITSMDDINYLENKVLTALRVPKTFLNFQDAQGKGQNLSIMDIRFCRMINRFQQALLTELNKIAIIHLYLLGLTDDLTNFTISMNTPSTQIEAMELENLQKRLSLAQTALQDPGNGIQIFSLHKVLKEIMGMSDKEISDNLNEIRLEKGLVAELEKTPQIIKRTGLFDPVDKIYGETGAEYTEGEEGGGDGGPLGGGGGGPFGGADFGSGLDTLGEPGSDDMGTLSGEEGMTDMSSAPMVDNGEMPLPKNEMKQNKKMPLLTEEKSFFNHYLNNILKEEPEKEKAVKRVDLYDKNFFVNEELNEIVDKLNELITEDTQEQKIDISLKK